MDTLPHARLLETQRDIEVGPDGETPIREEREDHNLGNPMLSGMGKPRREFHNSMPGLSLHW